jgi:hypothetical protein
VYVVFHAQPPIVTDGEVSGSKQESQVVSIVLRTIPLLAATCLVGFALLQLLLNAGSW